jgi:hypothetical protein
MYKANGNSAQGLPYDVGRSDSTDLEDEVARLIAAHGTDFNAGAVDKRQWHVAFLRSGEGENKRCLWLDYDNGGGHGASDGMNLGLYGLGLDLMPDNGYPPTFVDGWGGSAVDWYGNAASHNTVIVDGQKGQRKGPIVPGETTLWAPGDHFSAMRMSGPEVAIRPRGGQQNNLQPDQYERTVALVDLSAEDYYVLDIFRVVGGREHTKFFHAYFSAATVSGLDLEPAPAWPHSSYMRDFRVQEQARPGWYADFALDDVRELVDPERDLHVGYTDLTEDAAAYVCEGWYVLDNNHTDSFWVPRLMVQRQDPQGDLASAFVSVIEPYEDERSLAGATRLPLHSLCGGEYDSTHVAVEVEAAEGTRDLLVAMNARDPRDLVPRWSPRHLVLQRDWDFAGRGELFSVRRNPQGEVSRLVLCGGTMLRVGEIELKLREPVDCVEIVITEDSAQVVTGDPAVVRWITRSGQRLEVSAGP